MHAAVLVVILWRSGCSEQVHDEVYVSVPTRTIMFPFVEQFDENVLSRLLVRKGGEDELPDGPEGFVVHPGPLRLAADTLQGNTPGSMVTYSGPFFIITDPLRNRLAHFDSTGKYLGETNLGFRPRKLVLHDGVIVVQNALTDKQYRVIDFESVVEVSEISKQPAVFFDDATRRSFTISGPDAQGQRPLSIDVDEAFQPVSSVSVWPSSVAGELLIALESLRKGRGISVETSMQLYAETGNLLKEWRYVKRDTYIPPTSPFLPITRGCTR